MTGLEQAFYIIAIIFMSLMFIMIALLVIGVFIIRAKINRIHDTIENKVELAASLTGVASGARALRQVKKAIDKAKSQ